MNSNFKAETINVVHRQNESIDFFSKLLNTFGETIAKIFLKATEME